MCNTSSLTILASLQGEITLITDPYILALNTILAFLQGKTTLTDPYLPCTSSLTILTFWQGGTMSIHTICNCKEGLLSVNFETETVVFLQRHPFPYSTTAFIACRAPNFPCAIGIGIRLFKNQIISNKYFEYKYPSSFLGQLKP